MTMGKGLANVPWETGPPRFLAAAGRNTSRRDSSEPGPWPANAKYASNYNVGGSNEKKKVAIEIGY